jgi:hypothetical protein
MLIFIIKPESDVYGTRKGDKVGNKKRLGNPFLAVLGAKGTV